MNQRTAQWFFVGLNILAIPIVFYPIVELFQISVEVSNASPEITYDSGDFYFLLMSVFWVMWVIQYIGRKGDMAWVSRKAHHLLIGWFIGCIILAILIPIGLEYGLNHAGYKRCEQPKNLARRMSGQEMHFSLGLCEKNASGI